MTTTTTTSEEKPPATKPVLEWASKKKTLRDYLCLAATMRGWDPRQDEGSIDENHVLEEEYDAAILAAKELVAKLRTPNQQLKVTRAKQVVLLAHSYQLLAIIVRKPNQAEFDALMAVRNNPDIDASQTQEHFAADLASRLLWPANGSEELSRILEEEPAAYKYAFPKLLMEYCGADGLAQLRRG